MAIAEAKKILGISGNVVAELHDLCVFCARWFDADGLECSGSKSRKKKGRKMPNNGIRKVFQGDWKVLSRSCLKNYQLQTRITRHALATRVC